MRPCLYKGLDIKINDLKGTNPQVVNGQRLKHYLSGNLYEVEADVIQVITPEEHHAIDLVDYRAPDPFV